jgi:hypothetical protein
MSADIWVAQQMIVFGVITIGSLLCYRYLSVDKWMLKRKDDATRRAATGDKLGCP